MSEDWSFLQALVFLIVMVIVTGPLLYAMWMLP